MEGRPSEMSARVRWRVWPGSVRQRRHGCDADVAGVVGCWLDAIGFVVGCSVMMEARIA